MAHRAQSPHAVGDYCDSASPASERTGAAVSVPLILLLQFEKEILNCIAVCRIVQEVMGHANSRLYH